MLVPIMSTNKKVNLLYCFDDRYWKMAAVSIYSALKNRNPDTIIDVYCMVAPHTGGRRKLRQIFKSHPNCRLIWRVIRRSENPFSSYAYKYWSPVIFYRLFSQLIFPHLDKILYLDSDTLVQTDILDVYNTDISEYACAGTHDVAPDHLENDPNGKILREFKEKYLKHNLYINSGVLLLNLGYLRENINELLSVDIPLRYPDQDLLNVAWDGKIRELAWWNNCVPMMLRYPRTSIDKHGNPVTDEKIPTEIIDIVHFYAMKPYYYNHVPLQVYTLFYKYTTEIGLHPQDFIKTDKKYYIRRLKQNKTGIPLVRIGGDRRIHFLWWTI